MDGSSTPQITQEVSDELVDDEETTDDGIALFLDHDHERTYSLIDDLTTNDCERTVSPNDTHLSSGLGSTSSKTNNLYTELTAEKNLETTSTFTIPSEFENYSIPPPPKNNTKLSIIDENEDIEIDDDLDNVREIERYLTDALNLTAHGNNTNQIKTNTKHTPSSQQYITISMYNIRGFSKEGTQH